MTEINDKIGLRKFLTRIFIAQSGVSSRRVAGFICLFTYLFLVFFQFPIEYVKTTMWLIIGFFALTTISSYGQKNDGEQQNTIEKG